MQELNEQQLRSLMDILKEEDVNSPSEPSIIEYPATVLFTDGGIMLEWPNTLVDDRSPLFRKLVEAGKRQPKMLPLRKADSWRDFLTAGEEFRFHPVEEAEPDGDTKFMGCMDFICRTRRCHYRAGYIVAIEKMLGTEKLSYRCFVPTQNEDLVVLCAFDSGKLAGAVANEV